MQADTNYVFANAFISANTGLTGGGSVITRFMKEDIGLKIYEYTNHLGNVLLTTNDKRLRIDNNSDNLIDSYLADDLSKSDYYPYGMAMVGRNSNISDYRFGYQGSEMDNEHKGNGNSYSTFYRQMDPRLGRWFTADPKHRANSWQSPYSYANDSPIMANDPRGDIPPQIIAFVAGMLVDVLTQVGDAYFLDDEVNSLSEALGEIDWWWATYEGALSAANPAAAVQKLVKVASSPLMKKIIDEVVESSVDMIQSAVNSYYKEGQVDVYDLIMESILGPAFRKVENVVPKLNTPKLDNKLEVVERELDRQKRITNATSSAPTQEKLSNLQNQSNKLKAEILATQSSSQKLTANIAKGTEKLIIKATIPSPAQVEQMTDAVQKGAEALNQGFTGWKTTGKSADGNSTYKEKHVNGKVTTKRTEANISF